MKAADVRICKALDPGESYVDPAFLLVETTVDDGKVVTTIEHLTSRHADDGRMRWHLTRLGQSVRLTHAAALQWAVSFAASRDIPIVYERDDSVSNAHAAAPNAEAVTSFSRASK